VRKAFKAQFEPLGWSDAALDRRFNRYADVSEGDDARELGTKGAERKRAGQAPAPSYNQTDFVKERVAVEVQFGKYAFVAYDLFVKHMAFFVGDKIDVGVEVLPMKSLQVEMSSGVPYYEGGLYDLIREGRGVPAVPLVLVGVAA
jgi:hypothetical protein